MMYNLLKVFTTGSSYINSIYFVNCIKNDLQLEVIRSDYFTVLRIMQAYGRLLVQVR
jgi:hypothetical protein